MKRATQILGVLALLFGGVGLAKADTITGPTLTANGGGWTTTGLGFTALDNSTLTSFTYQNQGQADTIILTDGLGNILQQVSTPAGNTSNTVSVNWGLTSGNQYWLLQTTASNELYADYNSPLPSDADISITQSGTFDYSIAGAVADSQGWGANEYWAAFNNITTSSASAVPEPASLLLFGLGIAGLAGYDWRRRKQLVPA